MTSPGIHHRTGAACIVSCPDDDAAPIRNVRLGTETANDDASESTHHLPMPHDSGQPQFTALVERLYHELHALAHMHLRRERDGHTLNTTGLVHEAWLRLSPQRALAPDDTRSLLAIASVTMRRVLVDYARERLRLKRGGGALAITLDDEAGGLAVSEADELVALDEALDRLGELDSRARDVVVHRFFGGHSLEETAALLGVSAKTVQRDWLAARAWLRKELEEE
jgi:RNA polymerase sigma-70 factor, ECF subfamily